ncbi:MAG: porin [Spirosomataceae bacterium]
MQQHQYQKKLNTCRWSLASIVLLLSCVFANAQQLMDVDTSRGFGRDVLSMYKKFEHMRISGYIQPQFQFAESRGIKSFNGGDFAPNSDNRFSVRRGRFRLDYARYKDGQPSVLFVFQFDCSERGVFTRDFWGRYYENRFKWFSLTAGMFARPFGYEVNLGSGDRESPERGRMSQLLMRTERDLGAMLSIEPRIANHPLRHFRIDAGFFNGQGLSATTDFDSHKDFITRLVLKPTKLKSKVTISGGVSAFLGGMEQFTKQIYRMQGTSFVVDSSTANVGQIAPRRYVGADVQVKIPNRKGGATEFRAEYIAGSQTAMLGSTESPGAIPLLASGQYAPLYIRKFDGAYFYFLQHLGHPKHQLVLKYDWYDPNKAVKGTAIGKGFSWADIRYDTYGMGYVYYANENVKLTLWYEKPVNEATSIADYTSDAKDNVFTCRVQYRF